MNELEYEEKRAIEDHIRAMDNDELIDNIGRMMIVGLNSCAEGEEYERYKWKAIAIRIELLRRLPND